MYQIFEYLYSVIVILIDIRNILAKVIKFCRKIKFIKILKFFSTIIFINQTILLSIDYLKYETVIGLKLIGLTKQYNCEGFPAISLCLKSTRFYSAQNESSLILDRIGKMTCVLHKGRKNLEYSSEINRFFLMNLKIKTITIDIKKIFSLNS
jgi:hypothetical protein